MGGCIALPDRCNDVVMILHCGAGVKRKRIGRDSQSTFLARETILFKPLLAFVQLITNA